MNHDVLGLVVKPFHAKMLDLADAGHEMVLILAPTGYGKTEGITAGIAVLNILRNPDIRILVPSHTEAWSHRIGDRIKQHLESPMVTRLYGPQRGDLWSQKKFTVRARRKKSKEPTVTLVGAGQAVEGGHYDLILPDDLVTLKLARSKVERDSLWDWIWSVLHKRRDPHTRFVFVGTRYDPRDLYQGLMDLNKETPGRVKVLRLGALLLDGVPVNPALHPNELRRLHADGRLTALWPREKVNDTFYGYPVEELIQERADEGPILFGMSRQNDVEAAKGAIFYKKWLRWYPDNIPGNVAAIVTGIDAPVKKTEIHDFYANYAFAVVPTGDLLRPVEFYLLPDMVLDRFSILEMVKVTAQLHEMRHRQWPDAQHFLRIEGVGAQHWLAELVQAHFRGDSYTEHYAGEVESIPRPPGDDKVSRAWKIQSEFENGKVVFPGYSVQARKTSENLEQFPGVEHDDDFDAIETALSKAKEIDISAYNSSVVVPRNWGSIDGYEFDEMIASEEALEAGEDTSEFEGHWWFRSAG